MDIILMAIFVFFISLLFALLEIEIEGKNGWAKKLPTWYRKSNYSKFFPIIAAKKPLTGYHLFMLIFMLLAFHSGFFFGLTWNLYNEGLIFLSLLIFIITEDFLWFQFNPFYGRKNFKKEKIWWDSKQKWILNFPMEFFRGILIILFFSLIVSAFYKNFTFLYEIAETMIIILLLTLLSKIFVKNYRRWYKKMREIDESKFFNRKIKFDKF